jgi:putative lipoic acid-binding regulatory protein
MIRTGMGLRERLDEIIARHAGAVAVEQASERMSGQGNFAGVTYVIRAEGEAQIAALFAEMKDIPGVLMVL